MNEILEWASLIAAFSAFASAVGATIGAYCAIKANKIIAKQQATLDFVNDYNNDERVSEAFKVIRNYKQSNQTLEVYLQKEGDNRKHFLLLMNKFEILTVGLDAGIYDRKIVNNIFGTEMRDVFANAGPMIDHIRDNEDNDIFSNMERMIDRDFS